MNLKQLRAEREIAGAQYAKALDGFRSAFVRLAAVERTLTNRNVNDGEVRSFHPHRLRLEQALQSFQHWDFQPRILVNEWHILRRATVTKNATVKRDRNGCVSQRGRTTESKLNWRTLC
jgi:hypothetical protein